MHSGRCASCGKAFVARPQVRQQRFCSAAACQRERRRRWQAERLQHDLDYRANQRAAQRAWRRRHPEYWRGYRDTHPKYVERNRQQQRVRDAARRTQADLAKMNAVAGLRCAVGHLPAGAGGPERSCKNGRVDRRNHRAINGLEGDSDIDAVLQT